MMKKIGFAGVFLFMLVSLAVAAFAQPTIGTLTDRTVKEGAALVFAVPLSAPNDTLSVATPFTICDATSSAACTLESSITLAGTAATINSDGDFSWTPSATAGTNTYKVNVTASDSDSNDSKLFSITVNDVPALGAISDKTIDEGSTLAFTVPLSADSDLKTTTFFICDATTNTCTPTSLSITLAGTAATINSDGDFSWTPNANAVDSGTKTFKITVKASGPTESDSKTFSITVNDVPLRLSATALSIGAHTQKRSNPLAEIEGDKNVSVTATITIKNEGIETIKNIAFSSITGTGKYSNAFAGQNSPGVELSKTELAAGETATATITIRVPENLDAVDASQKPASFEVGTLTFTAAKADGITAITPLSVPIRMQAENNLEFKKVSITFQGKSETVSDGKNIDGINPGEEMSLEFVVESKFNNGDDIEINRVKLQVISIGDNKNLDVSEREDVDDLGPEDTDTVKVDFAVEDDAKRGKEAMLIILTGEDENGALHGERWEITLEIEREDHEISVKSKELNPATVSCQESAELAVTVRNTGRNDEKDVFLRVYSPELNNYQNNMDLGDIDQNDEATRTFTIPVPEDAEAKNYRITLETYYDTSKKSMTDAAILTKQECKKPGEVQPPVVSPPVNDTQGVQTVVVQLPPPQEGAGVITGAVTAPPVEEEKKSFMESNAFLALLILGYVVIIGGGALVAIKLLRK